MLKPGAGANDGGVRGRGASLHGEDSRGAMGGSFSHGVYGPNGLYRAHGSRDISRGFAEGQAAIRSGVAGRAFGDTSGQIAVPSQPRGQVNAGFGSATPASHAGTEMPQGSVQPGLTAGLQPGVQAGAQTRPSSWSRPGASLPGTLPGGADISRWGGAGHAAGKSTGAEPGRTPELTMLVVDEDESARATCSELAVNMGFHAIGVSSAAGAREILHHQTIDLMMLDLKLPGQSEGLALVEEVKTSYPQTAVVVTTAYASVDSAVEAIRIGVGDYLTKPFVTSDLYSVLERVGHSREFDLESRTLRERLRTPNGMGRLIGRSPEMEKLYRILSKVAHSTHPVLILGESGTGKELVARSIHENGPNAKKPFIPVDCGSLVSTLIESELFGYVKGAFTGANKTTEGLLAAAGGGTVFLDEIGEIPLDLQAKLLRALQEKEVRPVGATHTVPISARVLAATNRDLATMVEQGRFRKDLYFRLNVVNLRIPPLRDRPEDIPILAMHFLDKMREQDRKPYEFAPDALRTMTLFPWPGNVRELEHAIERACAFSSGPVLQMMDMPSQLQEFVQQGKKKDAEMLEASRMVPQAAVTRDHVAEQIVSIADLERRAILGTIDQLNGDKLMAAKLLGIGKTTLYRKLKEYGMGEDAAEVGN